MTIQNDRAVLPTLTHLIHQYFLAILVGSYALATFAPSFGLWLRQVNLAKFQVFYTEPISVSLSMSMLAFLLFNAGLGMNTEDVGRTLKKPLAAISGLLANFAVPVQFR